MKKVGIMTLFHNNQNYGAILQAYALTKYLKNIGFDAEQIDYVYSPDNTYSRTMQYLNIFRIIRYLKRNIGRRKYVEYASERSDVIEMFVNKYIPHSIVYNKHDLYRTNDVYDAFVVGSDQVWNPQWLDSNFFLPFVDSNKTKLSYAASIGTDSLKDSDLEFYKNALLSFDGISVRETSAKKLLEKYISGNIVNSVDPTLLLNANEWNIIASERQCDERYLFTYFLNPSRKVHLLSEQYARNHHLQVVNIPHVCRFNSLDIGYGDKQFDVASPSDFIALVRDAECIMTDSFHACVFSCIYKRNFFAFPREDSPLMNTRIDEITNMFGVSEHFLRRFEQQRIDAIECLGETKYQGGEFLTEALNSTHEFFRSILLI